MGMLFIKVNFPQGSPSKEALEERLRNQIGAEVWIETISKPAENVTSDSYANWIIHLSAAEHRFEDELWCLRLANEVNLRQGIDALNRCPNCLLHATTNALIGLGGIEDRADELPKYACRDFENWRQQNRGIRPPVWKLILAWTGMIAYFCVCLIWAVVISPYYLLKCFAILWKAKRSKE